MKKSNALYVLALVAGLALISTSCRDAYKFGSKMKKCTKKSFAKKK